MKERRKENSKLKLFLDNFLIYGLGGIINSIIPLVMLPIITRLLPCTEYYGLNDLMNTLVQFCSALGVLGLYDAMYRMFFERDDDNYKREICSTALVITIISGITVSIILLIFNQLISELFFGNSRYYFLVLIAAISVAFGTCGNIIAAPIRMQNKGKLFIITHAITPILSYSIGLILIFNGYYLLGLPIAALLSSGIMFVTYILINKNWFKFSSFNKTNVKQLLVIGLPLVPNFLIYWVFNSCDKLMIANLLTVSEAGIYSIGSKLGHASQLIYTAFAGGWQYFAFSTMKEKNQVESNSKIFEYLGILSFITTGFICAWSHMIFKILFRADYLDGYIVAPYLFLAPLLQMLFQVAANQFLIVKKTWPNLLILSSGAFFNILINYFFIPVLGIEGASLATLIGYIVSDIICVIVLCHMNLMIVSKRFVIATIVMSCFMVTWRLLFNNKLAFGTFAALIHAIIMIILYWKDFSLLFQTVKIKKGTLL